MTDASGVSVVICTWNRSGLLRQTLQSLRQQRDVAPAEVEVLVVDNNSSDNTKVVVEECAAGWPLGSLRYLFERRQGKQFALNRGIRAATFPVLAFTDDDIQFPGDWLHNVRSVFADPGVMLAGGKTVIDWDGTARPTWYCDELGAVLGQVDLGDARIDPAPASFSPGGANLLARATLFDQIGPFSESHFRHMDHELGMRAQARGVRVVYDPRLVVRAPVDAACLTRRYFRRWHFKAGIGGGGTDAKAGRRPHVSAWIYRQLLEDWLYVCLLFMAKETPERFARQMRAWRHLGTVSSAWYAWLRPGGHEGWVERHSQKRGNLY